ncbi:uncharacterized protein Z520_06546 [Fonsecaea multimorphosa CBS 102226]|uniref:Acyltransferase 3 domain-containing protein n=1 Tax=Fonsecaea multimorphosa CBS 102226 TaxID=1442371 RepID=A0A0D2KM54_9EURO|nr:uncharacterized protein Z520_06546 [Fonsecaea multimorphosa CBS 102226]KIX97768.1 hypothetical protein Z520_06546 [Fonsecaea multimorphosa CBS 102226]OAL23788.1 hypothetical protein AYO22_06107 [Fonsecaea multimorphosa]
MSVHRFLLWLTPSFASKSASVKSSTSNLPDKISALDGLRGIACLIVLHEHWTCAVDDPWRPYAMPELATGFMWKPFVMLLWGGEAMVNLFFVMSGYVLSCKPLGLLYSSSPQAMYECIASSIFRRTFRLMLPTLAVVVIIATLTQMRAFEPARYVCNDINAAQIEAFDARNNVTQMIEDGILEGSPQPRLMREEPPPLADTFLAQASDVLTEFYMLARGSVPGEPSQHDYFVYDAHVWTIPVELKSSMAIFMLIVGTSMLSSGWRLFFHTVIALFCASQEYRSICLFVGGMIIAELDLVRKHFGRVARSQGRGPILGRQSLSPSSSPYKSLEWLQQPDVRSAAWGLCFVVGLYILSIPLVEPVTTPSYVFLARLLPTYIVEKNRLIRLLGAVITTWACINSDIVSPIFNNEIAQYLGRISFALYLTHGMLIRSLGYVVIGRLRSLTGAYVREDTSLAQFMFIWVFGYIMMLPFFLCVADLFWRTIDVPSVKLARDIERRLRRQHQEEDRWPRNKAP